MLSMVFLVAAGFGLMIWSSFRKARLRLEADAAELEAGAADLPEDSAS